MIKGTVIFQMANIGSKSEGIYPFLRLEDGKMVKVSLLGDNPFENTTLKSYDLKKVVLEGEFNENGKFIAVSIAEDAPAAYDAPKAEEAPAEDKLTAKEFPAFPEE